MMEDKPSDVVGVTSGMLLGNVDRTLGGLRGDLLLDLVRQILDES
jgi:hypothetical protein